MASTTALFILVTFLSQICHCWYGANWQIWENSNTASYIIRASTNLKVPVAPSPQKDVLALWPGMYTYTPSTTTLVQTIVSSYGSTV
jgi:hypothetical protein